MILPEIEETFLKMLFENYNYKYSNAQVLKIAKSNFSIFT